MGGSNDPSNLILLTVEEHALAHKALYEEHGHWQDFMAWQALSGQITKDEIRRELTRQTWTGRKHSKEAKDKIKAARATQEMRPKSEQSREKTRQALLGHKVTDATRAKISAAKTGKSDPEIARQNFSKRATCIHCGKESNIGMIMRWHNNKCKDKK